MDPIYPGVRSTTQQIASDYGRRFLIELIQNAYDAHPPDQQSGEISIYFAPQEDSFGVLYIANRGHGFQWSNVKALTNIGLSDKPAGENIGNKGLGFRSVLFVSDAPQVYSTAGFGPAKCFDGYCFRFAGPDDFDGLIDNPTHRELAKRDIPDFHVPIPLTNQPEKVASFACQGFVTVIRLPLRDESKRALVYEEIEELKNSPAPVTIFLEKISTLKIEVEEEPGRSYQLSRQSNSLYVFQGRSYLTEQGLLSGKTVVCEPGDVLIGTRTRVGNCSIVKVRMGASQDLTRASSAILEPKSAGPVK